MRVLHVAAELYPWVKSGGLGDVVAALPPAQTRLGVDARLLLPGFTGFLDAFHDVTDVARLRTPFALERVRLALARLPGTERFAYLVDHPAFYDRPGGPYAGPDGVEWPDNHRRFALLGWVAAAVARGADSNWRPDIVHGHDWHAGLAPAYLTADPPAARTATVFTIHNIAYRGLFAGAAFGELCPAARFFCDRRGRVLWPSVLSEGGPRLFRSTCRRQPDLCAGRSRRRLSGGGFDGLLRARAGTLSGILNGVDPEIWNPSHDLALPLPYGVG